MTIDVRLTQTCTEGNEAYANAKTHQCSTNAKLEETVADGVSEQEHIVGIDISALQVLYMMSTQNMTVKTNSSGAPDDTFNLIANQPVVFEVGGTNPFSADVTKLFLTNASGSQATFYLMAGQIV